MRILRKLCLMTACSVIIQFNLSAQENSKKDFTFNIIPQLDFEMLLLEKNSYLYSPTGNLGFKFSKSENSVSGGPDVIAGSLSYGQDFFSNDYSIMGEKHFHKLGAFGKLVAGKNTFLLKADDRGAKPFESYKNFEGLCFYARKIIDSNSTQLDIGGGLAATDTGIVLGGLDIFIVPLPMIHFSYKNQIIDAEAEWIGMPDAIITLFPEGMPLAEDRLSVGRRVKSQKIMTADFLRQFRQCISFKEETPNQIRGDREEDDENTKKS